MRFTIKILLIQIFSKVEIKHDEFDIESENLDLLYASNLVSLYNVKQFVYRESSLKVDKINFDILTKDLSMNMFKNNRELIYYINRE